MYVKMQNEPEGSENVFGPFDYVEIEGRSLRGCKFGAGRVVQIMEIARIRGSGWNRLDGLKEKRSWTGFLITTVR